MSEAPERIWAITEPNDISADILGEVYAQQIPDGMNGTPVEYIRADRIEELEAAVKFNQDLDAISLDHVADLEAKLAKAVEGLEHAKLNMPHPDQMIDETLAELTGGKDE